MTISNTTRRRKQFTECRFVGNLSFQIGIEVQTVRDFYAWTTGMLKAELKRRNVNVKANDTKAVLVELMVVDMLRVRGAAAASADREPIIPKTLDR